jgi:hypothetical protein
MPEQLHNIKTHQQRVKTADSFGVTGVPITQNMLTASAGQIVSLHVATDKRHTRH